MTFHNSIRIDGSVFAARGNQVIWSRFLPDWLITTYCTIAELFA
jgi:hypothetical protein